MKSRTQEKHQNPVGIVHIITSLSTGGAEMMLYKLLSNTDRSLFAPRVISLTGAGTLSGKLRDIDVPVFHLNLGKKIPNPFQILQLVLLLRKWRPQIVQTWMYHADFIGGIATRLAGKAALVWGIRHSDLNPTKDKKRTILIARICSFLSRKLPDSIVCCSDASRRVHMAMGYDHKKMIVIPNGFDLEEFAPSSVRKSDSLITHSLPSDAILVGNVGRYHPQKDHLTLLQSASEITKKNGKIHFVLCGEGLTEDNREVRNIVDSEGLAGRVHLLGPRNDISQIYPSFDLFVSSASHGEGFPNVIGEAMACGVPCVVTDVGDSALIVGKTGFVVPPRNPGRLTEAIEVALGESVEERSGRGSAARQRVFEEFDIKRIVSKYEALYLNIL